MFKPQLTPLPSNVLIEIDAKVSKSMPAKSSEHYDYDDRGYGVNLIAPNGSSVFLQGDDAEHFLSEVTNLDAIWENGSPNPDCFPTYESHLDVIIGQYF